MGIYQFFNTAAGWTECTVTGAVPAAFLNACARSGIQPIFVIPKDAFTLLLRFSAGDTARARRIAAGTQCDFRVLRTGGALRWKKVLVRRLLPLTISALLLAGLVWSKLFLWEIGVTGNETVPTAVILNALGECGVEIGSFWPAFTADQIRNDLILELPELAWATVNVYGSRAEVIVRERVEKPEIFDADAPTDLNASKAGFLTRLLVLRGEASVKEGSAVLPGETIISGRVVSPFSGDYPVHAVGDAEADTYYELLAEMPAKTLQKEHSGKKHNRWALIIGKNRYNFFGNSSISGEHCDKIITVYHVGVKALFSLPFSIVRETQSEYTLSPRNADAADMVRQMQGELDAQLHRCIGDDGMTEDMTWTTYESGGRLLVCLRARCSEHIAEEAPAAELIY